MRCRSQSYNCCNRRSYFRSNSMQLNSKNCSCHKGSSANIPVRIRMDWEAPNQGTVGSPGKEPDSRRMDSEVQRKGWLQQLRQHKD